jgi:hypothetical protein
LLAAGEIMNEVVEENIREEKNTIAAAKADAKDMKETLRQHATGEQLTTQET